MLKKTFPAFLLSAIAFISCSDPVISEPEGETSSEQMDASSTLQSSAKRSSSGALSSGTSTTSATSPSSSSTSNPSSSVSAIYWNQSISYGVLSDSRDKKTYRTTQIGSQNWMAENLNFIATVGESSCYDKKTTNCTKYGRLYNWEAASVSCPEGWHLPDTTEWSQLAKYLGKATTAGKVLKAASALWTPNSGNDAFGFAALPSGSYDNDLYYDLGTAGLWWTSSILSSTTAFYRDIVGNVDELRAGSEKKIVSLAVRCIQDGEIPVSSSIAVLSSVVASSSIELTSSTNPSSAISSSVTTVSSAASSSVTPVSSAMESSSSALPPNTIKDSRDGKIYKTVVIGTQTWMAENLVYLPSVDDDTSSTETKYYVYNYDGTYVSTAKASIYYSAYGVLYNWPAAMAACPTGWQLPDTTEWSTLKDYVGASTAGIKLKSTTGWSVSEDTGTDAFGFSALPGGFYHEGSFDNVSYNGHWWAASEDSPTTAFDQRMYFREANVTSQAVPKDYGLSVRCIQK